MDRIRQPSGPFVSTIDSAPDEFIARPLNVPWVTLVDEVQGRHLVIITQPRLLGGSCMSVGATVTFSSRGQ